VKLSEGLTINLSYSSITKVAAGLPRRANPSPGATPRGAEKGTAGPSEPGAGASPSSNENKSRKVQFYQWSSSGAAD
jgi:hypothetical protein